MTKAKLKITHPTLGEFESPLLDVKEDKKFLETIEENFKNGKVEYLEFNKDTSSTESRTIFPQKILNESILTINFYKK